MDNMTQMMNILWSYPAALIGLMVMIVGILLAAMLWLSRPEPTQDSEKGSDRTPLNPLVSKWTVLFALAIGGGAYWWTSSLWRSAGVVGIAILYLIVGSLIDRVQSISWRR